MQPHPLSLLSHITACCSTACKVSLFAASYSSHLMLVSNLIGHVGNPTWPMSSCKECSDGHQRCGWFMRLYRQNHDMGGWCQLLGGFIFCYISIKKNLKRTVSRRALLANHSIVYLQTYSTMHAATNYCWLELLTLWGFVILWSGHLFFSYTKICFTHCFLGFWVSDVTVHICRLLQTCIVQCMQLHIIVGYSNFNIGMA